MFDENVEVWVNQLVARLPTGGPPRRLLETLREVDIPAGSLETLRNEADRQLQGGELSIQPRDVWPEDQDLREFMLRQLSTALEQLHFETRLLVHA